MSDLKYVDFGSPEVKVIEECAELIKTICKAQRFGWFNYHPERPHSTNIEEVKKEMEDVVESFERLEAYLRELNEQHYASIEEKETS